jgi:histidyl-tRNA synthetase
MDAELIVLCARLWRQLGLDGSMELQLNTIGSATARRAYREALVVYLQGKIDMLDEDSQRRLLTNPLRILDSKNAQIQRVLDDGPSLEAYLDEEAIADFNRLRELLDAANVKYVVNRRLVRGLDYYNKTVFEWVTKQLGAQGTVCAGGRYDGLVEQLGGRSTPAVGCAMGMERLVLLLMAGESAATAVAATDVYVVCVGSDAQRIALAATEGVRTKHPLLQIVQHAGDGSFKSQMKKADKSGARVALIWGEDEVAANTVTLKSLRQIDGERVPQLTVPLEDLEKTLSAALAS